MTYNKSLHIDLNKLLGYIVLIKINRLITFHYFKTLITVLILVTIITPILWIISNNDTEWVIMANILWAMGSLIIFQPFIEHVYPHLLTKTSVFTLTAILTITSSWINIILVSFLLPQHYISTILLNTSPVELASLTLLYLLLMITSITQIELSKSLQE